METFVLLPFFLLSRIPTDANNWRYGPEYTFNYTLNYTTQEDSSINQLHTMFKCRPRDLETLHCQFGDISTTHDGIVEVNKVKKNSSYDTSFDIKFDRRGIQSLVIPRHMSFYYISHMLASELNIGVDLQHKPDNGGVFNAMERNYIIMGQCMSLVNISSMAEGNEVSGMENYEIVPLENSILKKKRGEVLVIEKTRDLENCLKEQDYMSTIDTKNKYIETLKLSRNRIEISDMGYDSYTENTFNVTGPSGPDETWLIHKKIRVNLISVRPAEEALEPFSNDTMTKNLYN